jgi:hypothetical protein
VIPIGSYYRIAQNFLGVTGSQFFGLSFANSEDCVVSFWQLYPIFYAPRKMVFFAERRNFLKIAILPVFFYKTV